MALCHSAGSRRRLSHPFWRAAWALAAALLLVGWTGKAVAQQQAVSLTAEVGFDGYYKQNQWTPVRVTVANSGPDVEGFIVVDQAGNSPSETIRYQTPINLPGQSRKTVTLLVGTDEYQSRMVVKLIAGGRSLAEVRVPMDPVAAEGALYAIASDNPADLSFLTNLDPQRRTASVAYLTLDELPAVSAAWGALDLLVLNDVDTGKLSPDQRRALMGWLSAGGHLVVTGGPNWQKTAAALAPLLPVEIVGSDSILGFSSLEAVAGPTAFPMPTGPFVVAKGEPRDGQVVLAEDDFPLLVRRPEGLGTVHWLALDLALPPLRDWPGSERLWRLILSGTADGSSWNNPSINSWAAREGLRSIPSLALPSAMQMVLFLGIYTLLIGPANYLVLKRLRRPELAWLTIPALILLFSGLAYLTGFQLRGGEVVLNRLSLVYGAAGSETARARTVLGVFSPRRATYDVTFSGGTLVRPLVDVNSGGGFGSDSWTVVEETDTIALRDLQVDVAAVSAFRADADVVPPALRCQLRLEIGGTTRLSGYVTNEAGFTLRNAGVMLGGEIIGLGDLAAGQTVSVDRVLLAGRASRQMTWNSVSMPPYVTSLSMFPGTLPVDELVGGTDYWSDKALNRRFQILQTFLASGQAATPAPHQAVLFAWSEEELWPAEVVGRDAQTVDTVGYFLEVPLALSAGQETLVIPPALTTWEPLDNQRMGDAGPYDFYLTNGWASFEFRPWILLDVLEVEELVLTLESNDAANGIGQQPVVVSMWDWVTGNWVRDESLTWGPNQMTNPANLIGPDNAVRVRLESPGSAGVSIRRLDVTFVGAFTGRLEGTVP